MTSLKRAWFYITRKKSKSVIMFLILFGIATATISGMAIKKATNHARGQMDEAVSSSFSMTHNLERSLGIGTRGLGEVPADVVNEIAGLDGIESYNTRLISEVDLIDVKKAEGKNSSIQMDESYLPYQKVVDLEGTNDSSLNDKFVSGILTLTEGRHIEPEDQQKVLVHEDFAKQNGLKLHDHFSVERSEHASIPIQNSTVTEPMELEIIGLFSGENSERASNPFDLVENVLMADLDSTLQFRGEQLETAIFQEVHFYTKNEKELTKVLEQINQLPFDASAYKFTKTADSFPSLTGSFDQMDRLINQLLIGIVVISAVILSLVLAFWVNGRVHETGVLLSLGISKVNIIVQYILEICMIAVVAFGLSYFSGQTIAQKIGDNMVEQAGKESASAFNQELGGMQFGGDPLSSTVTKTIDAIDVTISLAEMGSVWLIGGFIILLSVSLSSIFIIRLKPKEILSKMS